MPKIGFEVRFLYVALDDPERNVQRVRLRVLKGGHDGPRDRILERHGRSLAQKPWFLEAADRAYLFDNSREQPRLVGERMDGHVLLDPAAPALLAAALRQPRSASGRPRRNPPSGPRQP